MCSCWGCCCEEEDDAKTLTDLQGLRLFQGLTGRKAEKRLPRAHEVLSEAREKLLTKLDANEWKRFSSDEREITRRLKEAVEGKQNYRPPKVSSGGFFTTQFLNMFEYVTSVELFCQAIPRHKKKIAFVTHYGGRKTVQFQVMLNPHIPDYKRGCSSKHFNADAVQRHFGKSAEPAADDPSRKMTVFEQLSLAVKNDTRRPTILPRAQLRHLTINQGETTKGYKETIC